MRGTLIEELNSFEGDLELLILAKNNHVMIL
jgi:hypothetical protein